MNKLHNSHIQRAWFLTQLFQVLVYFQYNWVCKEECYAHDLNHVVGQNVMLQIVRITNGMTADLCNSKVFKLLKRISTFILTLGRCRYVDIELGNGGKAAESVLCGYYLIWLLCTFYSRIYKLYQSMCRQHTVILRLVKFVNS